MVEPRGIQRVRLQAQRHGLRRALGDVALKAANRIVLLKILRGVTIERPDPAFLECPERYTPMFLPAAMIREFARDEATDLPGDFVDQALAKGDDCFGFLAGGTLAAYGWYSSRPTRIDPPDLVLRFGSGYVYMYKGFTDPRHRGQRLHAIGMTMALRHYLAKGYKGIVSYVEADNFDSLKSCDRMGYARFGTICAIRILGRYLTHSSRGCAKYEFRVAPAPATDPPVA